MKAADDQVSPLDLSERSNLESPHPEAARHGRAVANKRMDAFLGAVLHATLWLSAAQDSYFW